MSTDRAIGFAPQVSSDTRVLVLGSLPGVASLKLGQYYGHPRNAFWPIMGQLTGETLAQMPYPQRLERLLLSGIGLWDVLASAERSGSLDAAIRSEEAADLTGLVDTLPRLCAIGFNGAMSAKVGRRILQPYAAKIDLIDLPSSSPAHARSLDEKARHWSVLLPYLKR